MRGLGDGRGRCLGVIPRGFRAVPSSKGMAARGLGVTPALYVLLGAWRGWCTREGSARVPPRPPFNLLYVRYCD